MKAFILGCIFGGAVIFVVLSIFMVNGEWRNKK